MGGGAIDLIWGPDLELNETSTDVYKFLGGEKYEAVMAHIHSGLGIPSSLSGSGGTFSDNFLSLRTMIERLQYGRDILKAFWDNEIRLVQKAMGFRYPAQVTFANINLHDEQAEKALWIQLRDRHLISQKTLQEKFGVVTEIEDVRIKREAGEPLIGPYTDGEPTLSMHKIYAQRGVVSPSETGTELKERKSGEKNAIEQQGKIQIDAVKARPEPTGPTGVGGQGRPGKSKDKKKRKQRATKPRSTAEQREQLVSLTVYANQLQNQLDQIVNPYYLTKFKKKNLRQLTGAEVKEMDKFKFDILFNCEFDPSPEASLLTAMSKSVVVYDYVEATYNKFIEKYIELKEENPSYEELKQVRSSLYAMFKGEYE